MKNKIIKNFFSGKVILVTGGSGFIGYHLVRNLLRLNCKVIVLDNKKTDRFDGLDVDFIEADITSPLDLRHLDNIDIVYHLAALTDIKKFHSDLDLGNNVNVIGTQNVIEGFQHCIKKFVYVSTLGVYGNSDKIPVNESMEPKPLEPYAKSKLEAENFTIRLCKKYGVESVIARVFNCYGDGQDKTFLVPSIIYQLLNSDKVTIGNTKPTRDFIYVEDVVDALVFIGQKNCTGIYNIGSGIETSVGDLVSLLVKLSGKKISVIELKSKYKESSIEVLRSCADITKLKSLGWLPKNLLREGLERTYHYYEKKYFKGN